MGFSTSSGDEDKRAKSLEAENKELRARLEALEKKGGEGAQGGQGPPPRRQSGLEEKWGMGMDVEDEIEIRKKLNEQKRKLEKEMREIEKLSCLPEEVQEGLKNSLQQQQQEVEQRRHDLMPEYQKALKTSQKMQIIQDKRRNMQKERVAAQEEMRKIRDEIDRNEERFPQLSDKLDKIKMVYAEMAVELQGLQAGRERRGSNASQAVDCCMEMMLEQMFVLQADRARSKFDAVCRSFYKKFEAYTQSAQMSRKEGGRRNSEVEQEQDKASQQPALSASGGCNEATPASSLELDLPRSGGTW